MSSPFPPNATLTFQLPVSGETIDELGNAASTTEDLVLLCYLKEGKNRTRTGDALDAGEISRTPVDGRIVGRLVSGELQDLAELPPSLLPGAKATATIDRTGGNITGDFFLEASIPSAFGVDAVLGGKIRGYLVMAIAWGEAL
ncbi:MAG: hypothetical protein SFY66_19790 [Oculatellaceae cyanobacterium bins.114]|nr:hypothetical protein [Oculatellaceae cyanobacterium bins.114]